MERLSLTLTAALAAAALSLAPVVTGDEPKPENKKPMSVHDFKVKTIDGKDYDLKELSGKVLMLVNVASQCGLTDSQYSSLESLYRQYKDKGLEILAFPANNFGGQEPGTNLEIKAFCAKKDVSFKLFAKISVKGDDIAPLYRWLTDKKLHPMTGGDVPWNFHKYLIGADGNVLKSFRPQVDPKSKEVVTVLEDALKKASPRPKSGD